MMRIVSRVVCVAAYVILASSCGWVTTDSQRVQRAEQALRSGDARAALIDFLQVTKSDPSNTVASAGVISASLALGDLPRARAELSRLRQQRPDAGETISATIRVLAAEGKWGEIASQFAKADSPLPKDKAVVPLVAQALLQEKRFADANRLLDEGLKLSPGESSLVGLKALSAFEAGDSSQALIVLEGARVRTGDPALALLESQLLMRMGSAAQAEQVLISVLKESRASLSAAGRGSILLSLSEVQFAQGKPTAALTSVIQADATSPGTASISVMRSRILNALGRSGEALEIVRKLRATNPQLAETHCIEGQALVAQKKLDGAEIALRECLQKIPSDQASMRLLARLQLSRGAASDAVATLSTLRSQSPFDPDVLATDLAASGKKDRSAALELVEARFSGSAKSPPVRLQAAQALMMLGAADRARSLLEGGEGWQPYERQRLRLRLLTAPQSAKATEIEAAARELVSAAPEDPASYLLVSAALRTRGQVAEATRYLQEGLRHSPLNTDLLRENAKLAYSNGDYSGAEKFILQARDLDSNDAELAFLEYRVKLSKGDQEGALKSLETSANDTHNSTLRAELARTKMTRGDFQGASAVIDSLLKDGASGDLVSSLRGELYLRQGKPKDALEALERSPDGTSSSHNSRLRLALAQAANGDLTAAESTARKLLEDSPDSFDANGLLVDILVRTNRRDDAYAVARKFRSKSPNSSAPVLLEARIAQVSGDPDRARTLLRDAYAAAPSPELVLARSAQARPEDLGRSLELLREGSIRFPGHTGIAVALSDSLSASGDTKGAMTALEGVKDRLDPLRPVVLNNLAWMYFQSGRTGALELAQEAATLAPREPGILDTLGWILLKSGNINAGLEQLRKSLALAPQNHELALHVIEGERIAGNVDRAQSLAREWRAKRPDLSAKIDKALAR